MVKELLHYYFELKGLQSDMLTWNHMALKDNPPRFYRLQIIDSYIRALNLGSISTFHRFEFIKASNYTKEKLVKIIKASGSISTENDIDDYIKQYSSLKYPKISEKEAKGQRVLKITKNIANDDGWKIFLITLGARLLIEAESIHNFKSLYGGHLSADLPLLTVMDIHENVVSKLEMNNPVYDLLEYIINPSRINYAKNELKEYFDYPDIHLDEIDLDFI